MTAQCQLPYRIKRRGPYPDFIRVGVDCYLFELVTTRQVSGRETEHLIASVESRSPIAPKCILERQAQLNTKFVLG